MKTLFILAMLTILPALSHAQKKTKWATPEKEVKLVESGSMQQGGPLKNWSFRAVCDVEEVKVNDAVFKYSENYIQFKNCDKKFAIQFASEKRHQDLSSEPGHWVTDAYLKCIGPSPRYSFLLNNFKKSIEIAQAALSENKKVWIEYSEFDNEIPDISMHFIGIYE